jgi:SAM-dependent methyltransferase
VNGFGTAATALHVLSTAFQRAMAWYKEWFGTRYYKLLYGHRDEQDARAWVDVIVQHGGMRPGMRLLDLGCGRGRHARLFAEHGLKVTGIDLSSASIDDARSEGPGVEFLVHDMRKPFAREQYDAVVCLFTSLGYSEDRADDQRAVENAALALVPGGLLVLDLLNGALVRAGLVEEECQRSGDVYFTIRRCVEVNDIVKRIRVAERGEEHEFMERVHAWTRAEVCAMVERAGLRIGSVTEGPDPRPFDEGRSPRIVVWARKPGGTSTDLFDHP